MDRIDQSKTEQNINLTLIFQFPSASIKSHRLAGEKHCFDHLSFSPTRFQGGRRKFRYKTLTEQKNKRKNSESTFFPCLAFPAEKPCHISSKGRVSSK